MAYVSSEESAFVKGDLTRVDMLRAERNRCIKVLTEHEIDIEVLKDTDPNLIVGRKVAATDPNGNPMSYIAVKAKDMLSDVKKDRKGKVDRLKAINKLIAIKRDPEED